MRKPVPAVKVDDVKRVWSALASERVRDARTSVSVRLLASLCDVNANVQAVSFRAMLVGVLLEQGRLDRWRDGNSLRDRVFEVAATFPLPQGPGSADPDAFVAALEQTLVRGE